MHMRSIFTTMAPLAIGASAVALDTRLGMFTFQLAWTGIHDSRVNSIDNVSHTNNANNTLNGRLEADQDYEGAFDKRLEADQGYEGASSD